MNKKSILMAVCFSIFGFNAYADNHESKKYEFVKSDNRLTTQICYTIVAGTKTQLRNKVSKISNNRNHAKKVMKQIECNDKSTYHWAAKYASNEMKDYIVDRYYNNKIPKGKITIRDL